MSNVPNVDTTTTANITDSLNKRFVTDANITTIGNQSGTNTGDETTSSIQTKRPLKTIEGQSLEGAGNIDLQKSDVGLGNVDNTSDANKPVSIATQNALDLKVDKVTGKDLSDENYTLAEKNKLAGIEAGAEVNPNATEVKSLYESNANTNAFTDAEKTLLSNFGIELTVPKEYQIIKNDSTLFWANYDPPKSDEIKNIFTFSFIPKTANLQAEVLYKTDSIFAKYLVGAKEGSYARIEPAYPPYYFENTYRGLWKLEHGFMGGPLLIKTYFVKNKIVVNVGIVFAPQSRKRKFIKEFEAIL